MNTKVGTYVYLIRRTEWQQNQNTVSMDSKLGSCNCSYALSYSEVLIFHLNIAPPLPKCYIIRQPLVSPGHEWRWVTPAEAWRCGLSQGWGTRICTACVSTQTGVTFNEAFIVVKFDCRCHSKRRILSLWSRIDLDKQMISPLTDKFAKFYGAQNVIIIFTRTCHFILSWANWTQSTFSHCISLECIPCLTPKSNVGNPVPMDVVNFCLDWIPVT